MSEQFQGKVVVITGGGTGLGFALAKALAKHSANVAICSRNESQLREAANAIRLETGAEVLPVGCDLRSKDEVVNAVKTVEQTFGGIDILVNNAGLAIADTVLECKEEDWDTVIDTNLKGTFLMSQAVLPGMLNRSSGFILNIASQAAVRGYANVASYCASKFAIVGFSDALQKEVKNSGVRVHSICPGLIQTSDEESPNESILTMQDVIETILFILTREKHVKLENIGLYNLFDPDV